MRRTRRSVKNLAVVESSSDSEDEVPLKKLKPTPKKTGKIGKSTSPQKTNTNGSSSSESDIENYLQRADKIDFSSFVTNQKKDVNEFDKIEKDMFSGVTRLSDSSDSDLEDVKEEQPSKQGPVIQEMKAEESPPGTKLNFHQLEEYTRKLDEAKKQVEQYNAKKKTEEGNMDISNLLAKGESKQMTLDNIKEEDLHPSDFESSGDDWEEVKVKDQQDSKEAASSVPKTGLQITIGDMPDNCKKKKGYDLLAAMKRRLNRIRKENQLYVHKVHLLCWIAHGNYVNSVLNSTNILGIALSLLPSDKCYPSNRTDLGYLEQIVQWYKKSMKIVEKPPPKELELTNSLQMQMNKKEAFNKKMYVLIFIAILRALGIQCRLVLSLQVEPLRPPASELHSLSKEEDLKKAKGRVSKIEEKPTSKNEKKEKRVENSFKKDTNSKDGKQSKRNDSSTDLDKEKSLKSSRVSRSKPQEEEKSKPPEKERSKPQEKVSSKLRGKERSKPQEKEKTSNKRVSSANKSSLSVPKESKTRSKSSSESTSKNTDSKKPRSKSNSDVIKEKPPPRTRAKKVPQLDGVNDSSDEPSSVYQLDGVNDEKSSKTDRPNFKKLRTSQRSCAVKKHPSRLKVDDDDDDFEEPFEDSEDDFVPSPESEEESGDDVEEDSENEFEPSPQKRFSFSKKPNLSNLRRSMPSGHRRGQLDVKNDIMNLIKGRISEQRHIDRSKLANKRKSKYQTSDSDSDCMVEPIKKKQHDSDSDLEYFVPKTKVKKRVSVKKVLPQLPGMKIISDDSDLDEAGKKKKKGLNVWVEVFLEAEEKWITADLVKGQVHCVNELYSRATHPVSYIVAWNNDDTLKDVTRRYCKSFNTITRKMRVDAKWWEETLKPFLGKNTARNREEDEDLNRQQLDQPMPKAISEYKNHPLYALRRHLLKFEDFYPPEIQPLGFVRGEPVYPRNCVYVCKSREIWLKEARVVKPGEKPYKIVKARPKYDRLSNKMITDQLLEIFGPWQTMDYDPPTAENGIVPRNAFGNVELFKTCMLPKGTVHLKLPGLNRVCKKLNIDCATAIVGFDFHGGWSHPTYDGFVVCQEFEDQVVAAWEVEQEEIERKEIAKIDARVYGNWRKLIKGLLIRERLKRKYDFGGEGSTDGNDKKKGKGPKPKAKKSTIQRVSRNTLVWISLLLNSSVMRRSRRLNKSNIVENNSDSEFEVPLNKKPKPTPKKYVKKYITTPKKYVKKSITTSKQKNDDSSSSESDIENYLQPVDQIDFSSFFTNRKKSESSGFDKIEREIFSGVAKPPSDSSDSDLEDARDEPPKIVEENKTILTFHHLEEYTRKMEEAKKQIEKYNAKKIAENGDMDISNILAKGELKEMTLDNIKAEDLHSSDFETSEDDWEEVKGKDQLENKEQESKLPERDLEIIVGKMPDHCREKTGDELLAAMKRRLNRIRKQNQVFVHKVHLLCWIAHGNFVNSTLNNSSILALGLSLLPSDKCLPPDETDLNHLEQITKWYNETVNIVEKITPKELELRNSLQMQMIRKEAFNKKMYVLIFITILRALGFQCRLVFSLQVESLRPPESDLHSLSQKTKKEEGQDGKSTVSTQEKKSDDENKEKVVKKQSKTRSSKDNKDTMNVAEEDEGKQDLLKKTRKSTSKLNNKEKSVKKFRTSRTKSPMNEKDMLLGKENNNNKLSIPELNKNRSKSISSATKNSREIKKTRSKSNSDIIKVKLPFRTRNRNSIENIPQLDGLDDSSEVSDIEHLNTSSKEKSLKKVKPSKSNLKKSKLPRSCSVRSRRLKIGNYENNSEDEFVSSPEKSPPKKLKNISTFSPKELYGKKLVINLADCAVPQQNNTDCSVNLKEKNSECENNSKPKVHKKRVSEQKKSSNRKVKKSTKYGDSDYDSDYMPEVIKKLHRNSDSDQEFSIPKAKVGKSTKAMKISADCISLDDAEKTKKKGVNVWIEVFLEGKGKWITVDVVKGQVDCVNELYSRATHPVSYIVAWNNDNTLKDVTRRYCKSFNTAIRKMRVDAKWWDESLLPFLCESTTRDKEEDEELNQHQLDQPLPNIISEYKNHPLYVLRRHLLKYEVIYPPDIHPLGFVRKEPVFPRNSVYICRSRKIWTKDGKVVKPGEKPYKIVKAPPKWDRINRKIITGGFLDVFGEWQTMDFDPPAAENGVIPRNEYGNVELFKPNMLPKGTVHLILPGLPKVCRRLNVDCASVITGFEFRKGWNRPIYDGFIVCKEFEDQVVAAWELEQDEMEKREKEKLDNRVYGNWKKLIKGLFIREKLKRKYNFVGDNSTGGKEKKKNKGPRFITKKRRTMSNSESDSR
ncbi:hypothetical protein JTB14_017347 [Gonioctena quinquepunctata]|nr:hypothetical protein JTB14_017347 [Gonioctena quinquepunctata]